MTIDLQSLCYGIALGATLVYALIFLVGHWGGITPTDDYSDEGEQRLWEAVNRAHGRSK